MATRKVLRKWSEIELWVASLQQEIDGLTTMVDRHHRGWFQRLNIVGNDAIKLHKAATVWEDVRTQLDRARAPAVGSPAWTQFLAGATYAWLFAANDYLWFSVQIPHSWKEGSRVYPHIHFTPDSDMTAITGLGVAWELVVTRANREDVFTAEQTIYAVDTFPGALDREHLFLDFNLTVGLAPSTIDMTGGLISQMWLCRLRRVAHPTDTYTGGLFGLEFDVHYEIDTMGSRGVLTK